MNPLSPTAPPPRVGAKPSPVSTDAAPVLQSVLVIPWLPQAEDVQGLQPHASAPQLVLSGCTSFYLGGCGAWSHCGHLGTTRGLGGWAAREKVEQESERERERCTEGSRGEGHRRGGKGRGGREGENLGHCLGPGSSQTCSFMGGCQEAQAQTATQSSPGGHSQRSGGWGESAGRWVF